MVSIGSTVFITPSSFGQRIWLQFGTQIYFTCFLQSSLSITAEKAAHRKACAVSDTSTKPSGSCSTSSVSIPPPDGVQVTDPPAETEECPPAPEAYSFSQSSALEVS